MILTALQAQEIGEALLDAAEAVLKSDNDQSVVITMDAAVAVPTDDLIDDWVHVAQVIPS